jgi:C4-dicarboxylate transporter, DctQ subunit
MLKKVLYIFDNFEEYSAGFVLLIMAVLYCGEVISRYAFARADAWVEELLRYMMVYITFFGASVAIESGAHMSVNVIEYVPSKLLKQVISVFVPVMGIIFAGVTLYLSWFFVLQIRKFGQQTPALQIPMYIPYAILPLGFLSMLIRFTLKFVAAVKDLTPKGKRPDA